MPNPSTIAEGLQGEYDDAVALSQNLSLSKASREQALGIARRLAEQLGIEGPGPVNARDEGKPRYEVRPARIGSPAWIVYDCNNDGPILRFLDEASADAEAARLNGRGGKHEPAPSQGSTVTLADMQKAKDKLRNGVLPYMDVGLIIFALRSGDEDQRKLADHLIK